MWFVRGEVHELSHFGTFAPGSVKLEEWNEEGFGIYEALNDFDPDTDRPDRELLKNLLAWAVSGVRDARAIRRGLLPSLVVEHLGGFDLHWFCRRGSVSEAKYERIGALLAERHGGRAIALTGLVRSFGFWEYPKGQARRRVRFVDQAPHYYSDEQMLSHYLKGNA